MKMPGSVGTKKAKAVEQLLEELGVGEYIHDTFNAVFCSALAFFLQDRSVQGIVWYLTHWLGSISSRFGSAV